MSHIREAVDKLAGSIAACCRHSGRRAEDVRLMAVTKLHPASDILEAMQAGLVLVGENRVQEYERKAEELGHFDMPGSPEVHLIGHLQSNKINKAVRLFQSIDTLDSMGLAEKLNGVAMKVGRTMPVLLEVKLSGEESKTGLLPGTLECERLLEALPGLTALKVNGLMTIAPLAEDPDVARSCFRGLRLLRDEWAAKHQRLNLRELSMGMSGDYQIAIEEGSTLVRLGTAIFGAREKPV